MKYLIHINSIIRSDRQSDATVLTKSHCTFVLRYSVLQRLTTTDLYSSGPAKNSQPVALLKTRRTYSLSALIDGQPLCKYRNPQMMHNHLSATAMISFWSLHLCLLRSCPHLAIFRTLPAHTMHSKLRHTLMRSYIPPATYTLLLEDPRKYPTLRKEVCMTVGFT